MKRLLALAVVSFAAAAFAQPAKLDWCGNIGELAETMMASRQSGVPLDTVRAFTSKMDDAQARAKDVASRMVLDAYSSPRYSSAKGQQREIEEFKIKWQLACLKS